MSRKLHTVILSQGVSKKQLTRVVTAMRGAFDFASNINVMTPPHSDTYKLPLGCCVSCIYIRQDTCSCAISYTYTCKLGYCTYLILYLTLEARGYACI